MLYCCWANILSPCLSAVILYVTRVSEYGLLQDFLIVGAKPSTSTVTIKILDQIGNLATSQSPRAISESMRNTTSVRVMSLCPFRSERTNISRHIRTTAKVTHAPGPAPPEICNAQAMADAKVHTNQVNACGVVFFCSTSRIYGA